MVLNENKVKKTSIFFAVLLGLVILKNIIVSIIFTSFPMISSEFGLNYRQEGFLTSVFFIFNLSFIFLWVKIYSNGTSPNKILLISSCIWIPPLFLIQFANSYYVLIIFIALIGAAIECIKIYFYYYFLNLFDKEKAATYWAIYIMVDGAGGVLGVFFTSVLQNTYHLDWRLIFLIVGIFAIIMLFPALIWSIKYRDHKLESEEEPDLNEVIPNPYSFDKKSIKEMYGNEFNRLIIYFFISMGIILPLLSVWQQRYYQDIHGLTSLQSSIVYIFNSGGEFLGTIIGGLYIDKHYNKYTYKKIRFWLNTIAISAILFLIGIILIWKMPSSSESNFIAASWEMFILSIKDARLFFGYISIFLAFFFAALTNSMVLLIITENNNIKYQGTVISLGTIFINFGFFLGPYLGGLIADYWSLKFAMLIIPIFYFFSLYLIYQIELFYKKKEKEKNVIV